MLIGFQEADVERRALRGSGSGDSVDLPNDEKSKQRTVSVITPTQSEIAEEEEEIKRDSER